VTDEGAGLPTVRALREFETQQQASETGFVSDEARWVEQRCQGPAALSAPTPPVKAPPKQRRIVAVGHAPTCEVTSVTKRAELRLKGGFQH
jgi:hypothetical protein